MFAAALLLLVQSLAAAAPPRVSSGTARLALIEYPRAHLSTKLGDAFIRLLKESTGTLVSEDTLPCYYSDGDYRFRIPNSQAEFSTSSAILLDAAGEAAVVFPPIPELAGRLKSLAEDPGTYGDRLSLRLSSATASLTEFTTAAGETILTAQLHPERGESAQWHTTVVVLSRARWKDQDVSVLVIGKVFGGLGRLATAVQEARARGPLLGLARGGAFGDELTRPSGPALADALAGLGLQVAGVGGAELRRWRDLAAYRQAHPDGIRFISQ